VHLFLAGDAVQLMREPILNNPTGLGTAKLRDHHDNLSGGSCAARGVTDEDRLKLFMECDRTIVC
jgi:hypothetical protein